MSQDLETLKHGPAESGVEEIILKRWSPRSYADKPVSSADLTKIFTAAAWAASSFNEQPWRFLVGRKGDETYAKIFDSLVEFNQAWAKTAPVLILSAGKKIFTNNAYPNPYGLHDTGAAWALGYLGDPDALPEPYRAMETAARTRKPLSEFVFSAWDKAATL